MVEVGIRDNCGLSVIGRWERWEIASNSLLAESRVAGCWFR